MRGDPTLAIRILSENDDALRGIDQTESKLSKLAGVGKKVAAGLAVGGAVLTAFGISAIKDAGDLEQSIGAVDTVFGKSAHQMHEFGKNAAQSAGLARNEYNELATILGTQLKNGGTAVEQLAGKTDGLIRTGSDLAAMFGGTTKDAVDALSSALKGERDPIERYGVSLNQAAIDAKAAELGFAKVGGALSAEANQAATLALIMDQTKDAHGRFAAESDTFAGKQQRFTAELQNTKEKLGMALLPAATEFFGFLNDTAMPAVVGIVDALTGFGGLELGNLGESLGLSESMPIIESVKSLLDTLVATLTTFWQGTILPAAQTIREQFLPPLAEIASQVIPAVVGALQTIMPPLTEVLGGIVSLALAIGGRLMPIFQRLAPVITVVWQVIGDVISKALAFISAIIRTVTAVIKGDWSAAWDGVKSILSTAWDLILGVVKGVVRILKAVLSAAWDGIKSAARSAWDALVGIIQGAWDKGVAAASAGVRLVVGVVKSLPGKITSALGDLGTLLLGAGKKILDGLIRGIRAKIQDVKNTLGSVTNLIPDWKGPLEKDKRLLEPAGAAIMGGLIRSIDKQTPALRRVLGKVTGIISGTNTDLPTPDLATRTRASLVSPRTGTASTPGTINVTVNMGIVGDPVQAGRQIVDTIRSYTSLTGTTL